MAELGGLAGIQPEQVEGSVGCVWVLAGAPDPALPAPLPWLPNPNRVVAADGGSALAVVLGFTPDLLIGDLDSTRPDILASLEEAAIPIARYKHETKQETDTELAALASLRWNPRQIVILGAIGGRFDHTLGNVMLLFHPLLAERDVTIVEGNQWIRRAKPGRWNDIPGSAGDLVSLIPVGVEARDVRTEGLLYRLRGEALPAGPARGISNELTNELGMVWLSSGQLLIVGTNAIAG